MPLQATSGAASYDAFGGGVAAVPQYIEDVFSTYLYTGNGTSLTVTNNIDLSTKGGLVWLKSRSTAGTHHTLFDSARGANKFLFTDLTDAQTTDSGQTLNTTGFTIGNNSDINTSAATYASWTFRKQPKFFDVVTWVGDGTGNTPRTISHNLGSTPGFFVVKKVTAGGTEWICYHRSLGATKFLRLNDTPAAATNSTVFGNTEPTSTTITVGGSSLNDSGNTFVAYLFAHDAGGFGLTGTDNVISCGSFTTDGSGNATVSLGYEAQWVLMKKTSGAEGWMLFDNMRGLLATQGPAYSKKLVPNLTYAEADGDECRASSTGFNVGGVVAGATYIYIAIRRGPMKVPTSGTSVFTPVASRSSGTSQATPIFNAGFPVDTLITGLKAGGGDYWIPRLTVGQMTSSSTAAESSVSATYNFGGMLGILSATGDLSNSTVCGWNFRRAPSFFDVVCYTGTGSATTVTHNLGVAPELMIVKNRSIVSDWRAYSASLGATQNLKPNTTDAATSSTLIWNDTAPTSSVFTVGTSAGVNGSGNSIVAYLFATCAGVSKVGSYTGTGTTLQVNCGFTGGARFVLIKRTDSTGDWYVWDSARGIVAGNDPYLLLNSTAAEVTSTDYVDTYSAGFEISSTAPAAINASGGTFIFLAIA